MKILHLISSINRGGAENHLIQLATYQASLNHSVSIIYLKGDGYWKKILEKKKIKVIFFEYDSYLNVLKFIKVIFKIHFFAKSFKPNIIHAHLSAMELIGAIIKICNFRKYKFIITKHLDSFFFEASAGTRHFFRGIFLDRLIFAISNRIIFISRQVKIFFLKKCKIPNCKYELIYYGILKSFKKTNKKKIINIKKKFNIKKSDFVICNISRHVKQKNIDFLIKAFATFNMKYNNNSKLILIGSGPETEKLIELSKKIKISKKIIWIKFTENIPEFLKLSNVFCLPSLYEGFGLVLLESMVLKKPIIASNISAIPEVVKNNFNGILINPYKVNELINAFLRLQDLKYAKRLAANSEFLLNKKFQLSKMLKKTMYLYRSALKKK